MSAERERAEIFARLPLETLRRVRNEACERGNLATADEALAAISLRTSAQHEEIADGGRLYEHIEPPSPANGGRFITTYTGDPLAWMAPFMSGGTGVRINKAPDVTQRVTVALRAGERVQVVGADGKPRGG